MVAFIFAVATRCRDSLYFAACCTSARTFEHPDFYKYIALGILFPTFSYQT